MPFARLPDDAAKVSQSSKRPCGSSGKLLKCVSGLLECVATQASLSWTLLLQVWASWLSFATLFHSRGNKKESHAQPWGQEAFLPAAGMDKATWRQTGVSPVPSNISAHPPAKNVKVPHLDFVMPMKSVGMVTRAVVESIYKHYSPRRIFVVCEGSEATVMASVSMEWNIPKALLVYVDENEFFVKTMGMKKEDFVPFYDHCRDTTLTREFGWWWQQLLKLGCASCIETLSDVFIVWDSDLVVMEPWPLELQGPHGPVNYAAVLQEKARSSFNRLEYEGSVRHILGLDAAYPQHVGTYVAHHMPMSRRVADELVALIDSRLPGNAPWPAKLLQTSSLYYRMSEYMLYSTFEMARQRAGQPVHWAVHPFGQFGARGFRHREPQVFMNSLLQHQGMPWSGYSVEKLKAHVDHWRGTNQEEEETDGPLAHLQLEHVYGLPLNNPLLGGAQSPEPATP